MLTNREWASLILIGGAVVALLIWPKTRSTLVSAVPDILGSIHWKVTVTFLVMLAWIAGILFIGWLARLWDLSLLKDAIIITLTFAIPMLFRIPQAKTGGQIARRLVVDAIGFAAILEFYLNVEPFPLWAEVIVQAFATFFVMLNVVASTKEEWSAARKVTRAIITIIALGTIVWTTVAFVQAWASLDWNELLRSFLLTIWLPALLLPLYYGEAFLMSTEGLMVRLSFMTPDRKPPRKLVRLGVIVGLRLSVKLAARFSGRCNRVATLQSFRETTQFMRRYRADVRHEDAAERERVKTLKSNEEIEGTDPEGAQLDRREFHATKERLEWISTCEMGRYEGNGNKYWGHADELTDLIVDASKHGLPVDHGIKVETTKDGQKWRSWRTLPSGWNLGMGGSGFRSEWVYAADKPPTSWPDTRDSAWVNKTTEPDLPPDWEKDDSPIVVAPGDL